MRWLFFALILIHGFIHLMGFAKAFGIAEFPQLNQQISRGAGIAWLVAGMMLLLTGGLLVSALRFWWISGLVAVVLSQSIIILFWSDAKFGTVANLILLAGIIYGFASQGPLSFRAEYEREVCKHLREELSLPIVTEEDLEPLPEPVRTYLHQAGVVGQPRVHHFRAEWKGRIRAGANESWMEFMAEQHNFPADAARFFLMDATRRAVPVDVFHSFRAGSARMRVRLLSLLPIVEAGGPELSRAETVTLLNDLCLLAPSELVNSFIRWEPINAHSVRAIYRVGSNTISAVLFFNEVGELVNFVSDDRLTASADGKTFTPQRWSTPVGDYRRFGPWRLMSRGEGRWHPPEGEFTYIELTLVDLEINPEL